MQDLSQPTVRPPRPWVLGLVQYDERAYEALRNGCHECNLSFPKDIPIFLQQEVDRYIASINDLHTRVHEYAEVVKNLNCRNGSRKVLVKLSDVQDFIKLDEAREELMEDMRVLCSGDYRKLFQAVLMVDHKE